MSTSYICIACRQRISNRVRIDGVRQWRSAAAFVSLSNIGRVASNNTKAAGPSAGNVNTRRDVDLSVKRRIKAPRPGDFLESLFVETIQPEIPLDPDLAPPQGTTAKTYEDLEILRQMVASQKEPIQIAWDFLVSNFGPDAAPPAPFRSLPAAFKLVAGTLLKRLREERNRVSIAKELPTATQICNVYGYLQVLKQETWNELVADLLDNIALSTTIETREALAIELLGAWQTLGRRLSRGNDLEPSGRNKDWDFLTPSTLLNQRAELLASKSLNNGFFSGLPPHDNRRKSAIALLTFAVLSDCSTVDFGGAYKNHRFMILLRSRVANYYTDIAQLSNLSQGLFQPVKASTLEKLDINWSKISQSIKDFSDPPVIHKKSVAAFQFDDRAPAISGKKSLKLGLGTTRRKLVEALKNRDVLAIDKLWQEAQDQCSAELCNQFILSYSSLRYPNSAIDVWNHMVEASMQPTLATWNAMLEGCKASRSPDALEGVWLKMLASGAKPDVVCWTTRIHGLADSGRTQQAVEALQDMARVWTNAAKKAKVTNLQHAGDIDGAIKPTTSVINAAVHGLIRYHKSQDANRVLLWAAELGIKPDLITFNILLKPLVKEGRIDSVQALLQHMQSLGINADTTTFTTIMDEVIRYGADQSPADKIKAINDLLDQMAAVGLTANLHNYGKIIADLLSTKSNVNLSAVQSVLERMASEGLEPTMYIYTMLVTHHFATEPPEIEAARAVAEHVRLNKTAVDHVFWDRMIEGYSKSGYTTAALATMGRVNREGKRVGWRTMKELLGALLRNGEDETAKEFVEDVKRDRGGPLPPHVKGVDGQHEFWDFVASYGLIGSEGAHETA